MTPAATLSIAASIAAVCAAWTAGNLRAQSSAWAGNAPVYQTDIEREEREREATRTERRNRAGPTIYPKFMDGGAKPDIVPAKPPIVYLSQTETPGTIIVDTSGRTLYVVLPGKQAYAYPISVGRDGFTWTGTERISRIASWPNWTPPPEMHKRVPGLPITVSGGLKNPQGARALYLGASIYRIHGTNNDRTVGRANSSGCFRLTNEHVVHLASIVPVGTVVRVVNSYSGVSQSAPMASLFSFGADDAPKPAAKAKAKAKAKPAQKLVKQAAQSKQAAQTREAE